MQKAAILSVPLNTTAATAKGECSVSYPSQDVGPPDYYVRSNFVYPFNITNTVVRPLIN
jgi:hypothetical protein